MSSLALELIAKLQSLPDDQRLLVGLSGIPASGKSSLAHALVKKVNKLHDDLIKRADVAILVGLDGWHYSRATLATFTDPDLAFKRRGSHWTFDASDYVRCVKQLREVPEVLAPSFSHALKDPVYDDIHIYSHHRIVVLEGLYVFLSIDPWKTAGELLDQRWFVDVDSSDAMERILRRHVETGVAPTLEEARKRAEENDFPSRISLRALAQLNVFGIDGEFVMQHMLPPHKRLKSINDPSIAI